MHSLRAKLDLLEVKFHSTDLLCLNETWLGPEVNNEDLKLVNFHEPQRSDRTAANYGGVATYIKKEYMFKRRHELEDPHNCDLTDKLNKTHKTGSTKIHYKH